MRQVLLQVLPPLVVRQDLHSCLPDVDLYGGPHHNICERLQIAQSEKEFQQENAHCSDPVKEKLKTLMGVVRSSWPPLPPLHVELEPDEPVAADLLLPILQAAVGLRPDVRQVDRLPLQVGNQVPHLALYKPDPLELILLTLTGCLKHNEVTILGEKVGRFKKFVPRGLRTKSSNTHPEWFECSTLEERISSQIARDDLNSSCITLSVEFDTLYVEFIWGRQG